MAYQNILLGISIHLLIWEHLPHWGTWFARLIAALPKPLQTLYEQWRCPYCAGFWIGLSLHAVTGRWTFESFARLPEYWGAAGPVLGWFLDALAFALLVKLGVLALTALTLPALKGHEAKQAFIAAKAAASS